MTDQKKFPVPAVFLVIAGLVIIVIVQGALLWRYKHAEKIEREDEIAFQKPEELTPERLERIVMRNCQLVPYQVDGTSMEPAYKDGSTHVFYTGEKCPVPALVERGRVVLLDNGQVDKMVMKFVRGVPGDRFELDRRPGRISVLMINGKDMRNSTGRPYQIDRARQRMLEMYIRDYNGIIPENAYLLLGDDANGSLDSTQFGLVHVNDIRGVMRDEDEREPVEPYQPVRSLGAPVTDVAEPESESDSVDAPEADSAPAPAPAPEGEQAEQGDLAAPPPPAGEGGEEPSQEAADVPPAEEEDAAQEETPAPPAAPVEGTQAGETETPAPVDPAPEAEAEPASERSGQAEEAPPSETPPAPETDKPE